MWLSGLLLNLVYDKKCVDVLSSDGSYGYQNHDGSSYYCDSQGFERYIHPDPNRSWERHSEPEPDYYYDGNNVSNPDTIGIVLM